MRIKCSNTGRTISITFPDERDFDRVTISFANNRISILPDPNGHKICGRAWTRTASSIPEWPEHGLIELDFQAYEGGEYRAKLPATLPPPRPIARSPHEASHPRPTPSGNITLHLDNREFHYSLPEADLLPLALEWAKKGYLQ